MIEHTEPIDYGDPPDVLILPLCQRARQWCLDTQNELREAGFSALADLRLEPRFGERVRHWFEEPSVTIALFAGDVECDRRTFSARIPGSHDRLPVSMERLHGFLTENGCVRF